MKIIVTGDLHNEFGALNVLINRKRPDLIICCGDFGYWPRQKYAKQLSDIKNYNTKILWLDGNHEDHWAIRDRTTDELAPGIIYMPRGSTYTLPDGRNILFMGGAESIDKHYRTEGVDWFREEIISESDFRKLPHPFEKNIDIVMSHTCPLELVPTMRQFYSTKPAEPSNKALSEILDKFKPDLWYFGHWHKYLKAKIGDTTFYALNYPGNADIWWIELE